jgi:hypothetical protein
MSTLPPSRITFENFGWLTGPEGPNVTYIHTYTIFTYISEPRRRLEDEPQACDDWVAFAASATEFFIYDTFCARVQMECLGNVFLHYNIYIDTVVLVHHLVQGMSRVTADHNERSKQELFESESRTTLPVPHQRGSSSQRKLQRGHKPG